MSAVVDTANAIPFRRLADLPLAGHGEEGVARLLVAGDLSWSDVSGERAQLPAKHPWHRLDTVFWRHDLRIANLESPLTNDGEPIVKSGPHLRGDPGCARVMRDGGFDVLGLANNHILDMGRQGLVDTLSACEQAGLLTFGAGMDLAAARQPLLVDVNGVAIGLLAYCEHEFSFAGPDSEGAAPFDPIESARDLEALAPQCQNMIVLLHAGAERHDLPTPRLVQWCRWLVERGACAVVCSHTHVPSGVECYRGAPIVYGAGNFLFWSKNRHDVGWYCGALISLTVGRQGIAEAELIPYWQCRSAPELEPMTEADRIVFEEHLAALSEVITDPADLQTVWLEFCRTLRPAYLRYALGLSNKERRLVSERGRWPERRLPRARIPDLLNLYRCETHLDVITALLEEELAIEPPVPPRAG